MDLLQFRGANELRHPKYGEVTTPVISELLSKYSCHTSFLSPRLPDTILQCLAAQSPGSLRARNYSKVGTSAHVKEWRRPQFPLTLEQFPIWGRLAASQVGGYFNALSNSPRPFNRKNLNNFLACCRVFILVPAVQVLQPKVTGSGLPEPSRPNHLSTRLSQQRGRVRRGARVPSCGYESRP